MGVVGPSVLNKLALTKEADLVLLELTEAFAPECSTTW